MRFSCAGVARPLTGLLACCRVSAAAAGSCCWQTACALSVLASMAVAGALLSSTSRGAASVLSNVQAVGSSFMQPTRYLWCMTHFGPNNQVIDFVACAAMARQHDATVVLPPLFAHWSEDAASGADVLQFDEFYDAFALTEYVKVISLREYLRLQAHRLDSEQQPNASFALIDCYLRLDWPRVPNPQDARVQRAVRDLGIVDVFNHSTARSNATHLFERFVSGKGSVSVTRMLGLAFEQERCQHVFLHSTFIGGFRYLQPAALSIFRYFHRAAVFRSMARSYLRSLRGLLLVVHLRRGDWSPLTLQQYLNQSLWLIEQLPAVHAVYFMTNALSQAELDIFRSAVSPRVVLRSARCDNRSLFNSHALSVLEQELATCWSGSAHEL